MSLFFFSIFLSYLFHPLLFLPLLNFFLSFGGSSYLFAWVFFFRYLYRKIKKIYDGCVDDGGMGFGGSCWEERGVEGLEVGR